MGFLDKVLRQKYRNAPQADDPEPRAHSAPAETGPHGIGILLNCPGSQFPCFGRMWASPMRTEKERAEAPICASRTGKG